jgi:cellulose biosynthesis protein BcsQ
MIVTFYSFKGGTGRTMALASIAILLARAGRRVLAVDFDLEAPGLWRFFQEFEPDLGHREGLLEMLAAQSLHSGQAPVDWREYVIQVRLEGTSVSLITSGRSDDDYPARVLDFNWQRLFHLNEGGAFIERLRADWAEEYDFVLIDSRTGITDTGGVCTISLPDMIVAVLVANHQNVEGILEVLRRTQQGRQDLAYDRSPALVLPVLSRFDSRTEYESANEWLDLLAEKLAGFYADWLPGSVPPRRILERTKLPYVAYFSYGEKLPVLRDDISDPESLGYALRSVAQLIDSHLADAVAVASGRASAMLDLGPAGWGPSPGARRDAPAIMGGVPSPNQDFIGREAELEQIRGELRQRKIALVQGLGGIGKTQLATEYARRYQDDYDLIWWIPSDDAHLIRRSFVSLARRLGLPDSPDVQYTVDSVLDELRRGHPAPNWLLVYDGAIEPSEMRPFLSAGPGHVLITSRSRSWMSRSTAIELDVFTPMESAEFLMRRWPGISHSEAHRLAEELGHLPLALEQAAAVHTETGMPLEEYLQILAASPARALAVGESAEYPYSIAQTWLLAFERLSDQSPAAARLLEVCSFFSSRPISVQMLARGRGAALPPPLAETLGDEIGLRAAVRDIGRYALAQLDPSLDSIRIHTLVRGVLMDSMPSEQRSATRRSAQEVLSFASPGQPDHAATWPQHEQIAPHVIPAGLIDSDVDHVRRAVLDQVRYQYVTGDYVQSAEIAERAVNSWARGAAGADDELCLVASFHLGNARRALGEYSRAREINEDTWRRMRRILGEDHEYTLRVANSNGADCRLAGAFRRALDIDKANLAQYQSHLGMNDLATLRAANNLAADRRLLGEFRRAQELDKDTLSRRTSVLDDYHPELLTSIDAVVMNYYGLGEYDKALALASERLPRFLAAIPSHAFVRLAQGNVAVMTRKAGDYGRALELSEEHYELCRSTLGPRHEYTLSSMMSLFNALRATRNLLRAKDIGEETLRSYQDHFGAEHPFALACACNLAVVYRALGLLDEASALDEQTLRALRETLGPEHPYSLCCASNVSNDLSMAGNHAAAKEMSGEALDQSRSARAADHPDTLACAANHALDLEATGDHPGAVKLRQDTIMRMRRRLGGMHPEVALAERAGRAECDIELPPT